MIHHDSAVQILREKFGRRRFSAREAAEALPFTLGTTFVALSTLVKAGLLERIKKGVYAVREEERLTLSVKQLRRPEIRLPEGSYATATYALANTLSPISASRFLDIFVRPTDYPTAIALEVKTFPEPRVHPFAIGRVPREKSIDGYPITAPEVAFVDLVRIARDRRRPINFEFEVVPFIPQLVDGWSKIAAIAEKEGLKDCLDAIVFYLRLVAFDSGINDMELPEPARVRRKGTPEILSFGGGKIDDASIATWRSTGVIVEADRAAVRSILENL